MPPFVYNVVSHEQLNEVLHERVREVVHYIRKDYHCDIRFGRVCATLDIHTSNIKVLHDEEIDSISIDFVPILEVQGLQLLPKRGESRYV